MLARSEPGCQAVPWQRELGAAITRPEELLEFLDLDRGLLSAAQAASKRFHLLVPRGFAALMERSNPNDPLLRQVLPLTEELRNPPGFCSDPVGEYSTVRTPGLLRKYQRRALLLSTGACAVHCRYCFRRHFPYGEDSAQADRGASAIGHLAEDSSLNEVILSGGDPLMLDDSILADLVNRLGAIPHLRRLRLHTRLPIVLPSRVTDALCSILTTSRLQPVVVIHANHARELGVASRGALARLRQAKIPMLNQSVLLRGVNDNSDWLADLSEALFESGVLPYYLHLLDRVAGAAHFDVEESAAVQIADRLRAALPGYLVPRLVREDAGRAYKVPIHQGKAAQVAIAENTCGVAVPNGR